MYYCNGAQENQRARLESRKTSFSPQYFNSDRFKAVLLLWFLTVACSCCPYLYFGFEGRMCDLIVSDPVHCLSYYFVINAQDLNNVSYKHEHYS